ncbi:MAG: pilin [Gammaproteobacteria bacterium]
MWSERRLWLARTVQRFFAGRIARLAYVARCAKLLLVAAIVVPITLTLLAILASHVWPDIKNGAVATSSLLIGGAFTAAGALALRATAQRLHDIGRDPRWLVPLLVLVVPAGFVPWGWVLPALAWLALALWPGDADLNQHGPPPPAGKPGIVWILSAVILLISIMAVGVHIQEQIEQRARAIKGYFWGLEQRTAVETFYRAHGRFPSSNAEAGLTEPGEVRAKFVDALTIGPGGVLTLRYANHPRLPSNAYGRTLVMTPAVTKQGGEAMAAAITWDCRGGDLPQTLRHAACRE